jgi:hypothetical protein
MTMNQPGNIQVVLFIQRHGNATLRELEEGLGFDEESDDHLVDLLDELEARGVIAGDCLRVYRLVES